MFRLVRSLLSNNELLSGPERIASNMVHFLELIDSQIVSLDDVPEGIATLHPVVARFVAFRFGQYFRFFLRS